MLLALVTNRAALDGRDESEAAAALPRLLYLADVPVESSYHGSALVFRLLEGYPNGRLMVIEGNSTNSLPERRLPNVPYQSLSLGNQRLRNTRFHAWHSLWVSLRAPAAARKIPGLLSGFQPEAVLTVAHGYSWVAAAEFARSRNLPLHMIVHDDWPRISRLPALFVNRVERQFASVYRSAASRLCVSPFMVEEYCRRYGVAGDVLHPSRARDAATFAELPERLRNTSHNIVFAFAGTINSIEYCRVLVKLAECLERQGGRLLIFGPLTAGEAGSSGLAKANIEFRGLVRPDELSRRLRNEADVLFVPMSFSLSDRPNMEISFPSKLTEYTAAGLPILICGPSYCSAVRWAEGNNGSVEVATDSGPALAASVDRLVTDPVHRLRLAAVALEVGNRYFSHRVAERTFHGALQRQLQN